MSLPATEDVANRLLLSLPKASWTRLKSALEFQTTKKGDVVNQLDRPVGYHYFVNRGLISLVKMMRDGRSVEIGVIGIEGITSPHALFGINQAAIEAIVQIPGSAFRIKHDVLKRLMADDDTLRIMLERYAHFAYSAIAQTAACNRLHYLEERCCRWLLISHDSARSDTFQLTHEFLAMMLGVQRAGVSIAANFLQKAGLIRYQRGQVTVTNRSGLEDAACECYASMHGSYRKVSRAFKKG
ncbi:MAG: Crp/Fnr family transcriptional regulator [Xanthobacteraceae bacterium]|nr:Crp/Fnr family transcriptional regulator [Xanthobacteraceae bacterium]